MARPTLAVAEGGEDSRAGDLEVEMDGLRGHRRAAVLAAGTSGGARRVVGGDGRSTLCPVDWYLDRADLVGDLRRELGQYLERHAVPGSDDGIADAELIVSEAVGNAIRHTGGPVWVSLGWTSELPVLQVYDIGPGFDAGTLSASGVDGPGCDGRTWGTPTSTSTSCSTTLDSLVADSGRGLLIIQALAPEASASVRANAGMVVSVTLPVHRRTSATIDPPRRPTSVLPALDEARPEGGFGKESFLRAMVVQLSQALETNHGPDAAEAAIAQVGTDVGWQMEQEFRLAEEVVGRMTPEQLGHCFVRLKHAIDGGFSVVEASAEQIVLENTRCPFGDVGAARTRPVPDDVERLRRHRRPQQRRRRVGAARGADRGG